ncbi:hypothetical protein BDF19DRAFT_451511 [Syncephalis fuscata]|nr:hypothetical protein BDF19DRAFT_451511 [Syncephalis fuscata]
MAISLFEHFLTILPSADKDGFLKQLGDEDILELYFSSHATRNAVTQSDQYWRCLYGHHFQWRYAENELRFLIQYRNKVWTTYGRPDGSTVDVLEGRLEHCAFLGMNWQSAYQYHIAVEKNWRKGVYQHSNYTSYSNKYIEYSLNNSIGTSNVSSRFRNLLNNSYLVFTTDKSSSHNISSRNDDLLPSAVSLDINQIPPKLISPQISNDYYAVVKYQDEFFIQPTYTTNQWRLLAPPSSNESLNFLSRLDFGRWAILMKNASPTNFWLVNLATGQHCEITTEIRTARYVETADENGVVFGKYCQVNGKDQLAWSYSYYKMTGGGLEVETVRCGTFFLESKAALMKVERLGPGYVYLNYGLNNINVAAIFPNSESTDQQAVRYFDGGKSAYRINRKDAVVLLYSSYAVIELSSGNILQYIESDVNFDLHPIIGSLYLSKKYSSSQDIVDIYAGKTIMTLDISKDIAGNVFCLCSTFFANMVDKTAIVDIFDFSNPVRIN